jgi:LysM domain
VERAGGILGRGWPIRWRWARPAAVAAGLLLVERALVAAAGAPGMQLRTLRSLGQAPVDPVAPLLAALALAAEALVGYVLVVLVLRSLCALPGSVGRLAGRVALEVSPVVVRRLLDLLVGGTLLAQATLATAPEPSAGPRTSPVHLPQAVHLTQASSRTLSGAFDRAPGSGSAVPEAEPVRARPSPRRSAAPLPPWLGGGPSKPAPGCAVAAAPGHEVEMGDTLWGIAAARLAPPERSSASAHRYWQQIYRANRAVVGADPDLIHPGMRLDVPPFHPDRP